MWTVQGQSCNFPGFPSKEGEVGTLLYAAA